MESTIADHQEALASFLGITGTEDEAIAFSFLDATNWNLSESVNLYLQQNDIISPVKQSPPKRKRHKKNNSPINLTGDKNVISGSSKNNGTHSSESLSTNKINEINIQDYDIDEDGIRAPIPTTTGILSEDPGGEVFYNYLQRGPKRQRGFNPNVPKPVFEMFRDFKKETQLLEGKTNSKEEQKVKRLADLFRPPIELICKETFDAAKVIAMDSKRWLLVNIQDTAEFDAQRLNRDTWSNSKLKNLIANSFVFWQRYYDQEEGSRYCRFYPVQTKPHIAIIDPRTGELVKNWSGFVEPDTLMEELIDFLEMNPLDDFETSKKQIPIREEPFEPKGEKSLLDMTEEEQLAAVIAASMPENGNKQEKIEKPEDSIGNKPVECLQAINNKPVEPSQPISNKTVKSSEKNSQQVQDCVIQIRESNGNILKKSFSSTDKVESIYKYVEENRTDGKRPFQLLTTFPRKVFAGDMLNKTLAEADLVPRATVIVSLVD